MRRSSITPAFEQGAARPADAGLADAVPAAVPLNPRSGPPAFLVLSFLQLLFPVFTQTVVDKVIVERDLGLLNVIMLGLGATLVFFQLANLAQQYLLGFAALRIDTALLDYLTRRLLSLPMSYFASRRTGDIQRRLDGARQVRQFLVQHGIGGFLAAIQLGGSLAFMAIYSPSSWRSSWRRPRSTPRSWSSRQGAAAAVRRHRAKPGQIQLAPDRRDQGHRGGEGGLGRDRVPAGDPQRIPLRGEEALPEQFHRDVVRRRAADHRAASRPASSSGSAPMRVVVRPPHVGGFVAFSSLTAMAYAAILRALGIWDNLQMATVLLNRLNDIFEQEPEQGSDRSRLKPVPSLEGRIELRQVGFRYGGPEAPPILKDITLEIAPGQMVALVGRSGSGKTTLIKLLAGLMEPTEGSIHIDHLDMKSVNYRDLRRHIGMVLQENHIFDATIAGNISFGDSEPDFDRVLWSAQVANAHDFIMRLPMGYETRIGESGLALSGGQSSGSRSPGRSTMIPRSSSSTRPPARSTRSRSAPSRRTWAS
jgi:ABC-type multidrug transport system fused ATPase/permease subunit